MNCLKVHEILQQIQLQLKKTHVVPMLGDIKMQVIYFVIGGKPEASSLSEHKRIVHVSPTNKPESKPVCAYSLFLAFRKVMPAVFFDSLKANFTFNIN